MSRPVRQTRPPAPTSVSEEARAYLNAITDYDQLDPPAIDDTDGWLKLIAERNAGITQMFAHRQPPEGALARETVEIGGVPTYVLRSTVADSDRRGLVLETHGGGLYLCAGDLAWMSASRRAVGRRTTTWVPDFRNPPLHPYPAALDDCVAVYRAALAERDPAEIVVFGESGGANLAAATLLRAKDEGLPMPAGLVLLTPQLDLTESGDSFQTNNGIDLMGSLMASNLLYAGGHDLAHPYLSPLFGDLTGFPRTFLQTGTRDLFLSNAVRVHRRLLAAGVDAQLHVFEAMPHGSFGGETPEDFELLETVLRFEQACLGG